MRGFCESNKVVMGENGLVSKFANDEIAAIPNKDIATGMD